MVRAEIKLASGAVVTVDGTAEELDRILSLYGRDSSASGKKRPRRSERGRRVVPAVGPVNLIRELRDEGFFEIKQTLNSVTAKLAESGHIYSDATVGKALQRLTQSRELGRIRDDGIWNYVKR